MKHILHVVLFVIAVQVAGLAFCQTATTIVIPTSAKLKDGIQFIGRPDSISFYVQVEKGKPSGLIAKDKKGQTLPVSYTMTGKINNGTETHWATCTVCVEIVDETGRHVDEICYEIDCGDILNLRKTNAGNKTSVLNFPGKPTTGIYPVFKNDRYELNAVYKNGKIINYTARSFKQSKVEVAWSSNQAAATNSVKCYIVISDHRPDGTVEREVKFIPCDKIPGKQPSSANTLNGQL